MIVVSGEVVRRGVGRGEERGKGRRGDEGSRITRESRACCNRGLEVNLLLNSTKISLQPHVIWSLVYQHHKCCKRPPSLFRYISF